jgi:hypothetical protein
MALDLANITFDCADARVVGDFWSAALGRPVGDLHTREATILPGQPTYLFLRVPEGKVAKNRMHIDLVAGDRRAEVARLVDLGATELHDKDEWGISWTVLTDPEGNEFCVAQGPDKD